MIKRHVWSVLALALCAAAMPVCAQSATEPVLPRTVRAPSHHDGMLWAASGALAAASLAFDERLRSIAVANRSPELDRIAAGADVLGTAGHIVPALVGTYVGSRLLGQQSLAAATLRVGLSYAAADALESVLKPMLGEARPFSGHDPLTFRGFNTNGTFQSFPSAHVVHISSLATAIALEANRPWVTVLSGAAITYVGAQRVYRDQHWSSDVVVSGMMGVELARATMNFLHDHGH
ncbi:MAG TPA: phosphatase PAP2 family protein [Gemmatimonadaceae bacterium]|nr:phosphatase PAP2 family protein [Gemmatimonadaceae bacterium]